MTTSLFAKSNGTQGALLVNGAEAFSFDSSGVDSPFNLSASVAGNALTVTLKAGGWRFHNTALGTGTPVYVKTDTDLTITAPSGASFGSVNAVQSDIVVRVINNAGTLALSLENISGGMDLTETGLVSTTAIGAGSTSATVVYSGAAITSAAYRVAGLVRSTQATAGTWATAPSLVQGAGGQALMAMSSLGYGQTWQSFTVGTQRVNGTTYYNTTGKPISVLIVLNVSSTVAIVVNGTTIDNQITNASAYPRTKFEVPPGQSYNVTGAAFWSELR